MSSVITANKDVKELAVRSSYNIITLALRWFYDIY